jgi:hypothetical protein
LEKNVMPAQTVTLTLPEPLYERAKETAHAVDRSLEQVLTQSIALSLPALETDLSPDVRSELAGLPLLSDDDLWAIARSIMDESKQIHLEDLAGAQKHRSLTPAEQSDLTSLMDEAERTMLRKSEAYRLLARRGHAVFSPPESSAD